MAHQAEAFTIHYSASFFPSHASLVFFGGRQKRNSVTSTASSTIPGVWVSEAKNKSTANDRSLGMRGLWYRVGLGSVSDLVKNIPK